MIDDDVILAGEDGDFGLVRGADARKQLSASPTSGIATTMRNPLTDEIIGTVSPSYHRCVIGYTTGAL